MFASITRISDRAGDLLDLVIDFATLGEYGFEPAATPSACEARSSSYREPAGPDALGPVSLDYTTYAGQVGAHDRTTPRLRP